MSDRRNLVSAIVLGAALLGLLIFLGAYLVTGGTSVGGNIALGLAVVALAIYVFLRPEEVLSGIKSRQARYGGNALLMVVIFIAILVGVNFLSMRHSKRWDLTAGKQFTLAPESVEILKNLQTPITALNFSSSQSGGSRSDTATLLDEYRAHSDKFQVQTIDPEAQPTLARQYGVTTDGTVVLVSGDRRVTVSNPTESEITSALIKVTQATQQVVYVTTGHGDRSLDDSGNTGFSTVQAGLERDGFQVKPLMLATTNTVPSDAGVVIVAGPHAPIPAQEVDALRSYLARGGRVMIMVDTSLDTKDHSLGDAGLGSLLSEWGITLNDDLVFDPLRSQAADPATIYAAQYGSSPITDKLGNLATAFPGVRSMTLAQPAPANVSLVPLVQTSDQAWGASDLNALVQALNAGSFPGPGTKDLKGPLVLAASAENSQTKARLIVFGCSSFAMNIATQQPGNFDLFLNGVNWLAEQESQITIRPKPFETRQLIPTRAMSLQVFSISVIIMPLTVLLVGAIVWWKRR
jgi:ABC-type uncharacterized transport system involved in gliding motility auxiliary subunit